jgi:hypothetical protein
MLTRTRLAVAAVLLACSASGALAQHWVEAPAEPMRPSKPSYTVRHHQVAPPRQTYGNELPFAPF